VTVEHCVIEGFSKNGIYLDGYYADPPITPVIENCLVGDDLAISSTRVGIYIYRSVDATISNCTIRNCGYGFNIFGYRTNTPNFLITGCSIRDHEFFGIYAHAGG
jgi:parallel beta-helix repeat protein